jgi:glycosyltransferase involved in cell wall biosynthesis
MKILKVIHGYPPMYNAGSEVYSQLLCHGLSKNHEVHVFTREENPFVKDFALRETVDPLVPHIKLHIVNIPLEKYRYQYQHAAVDKLFANLLQKIKPDIVHIGHLNHLSTSLIHEVKKEGMPLVSIPCMTIGLCVQEVNLFNVILRQRTSYGHYVMVKKIKSVPCIVMQAIFQGRVRKKTRI